ncbi:hypothetical protein FPQ18DRAFT_103938 [Pyronema domesticum]|uniref:Uncharacterized protein n=1 Tax=Pyronema omphalodes (strain CBS 100304) TaxID=1076935 RepID=U4LSC5_PYROM|nr:hypothetical protein FPQ18DRAFT_103938 [Pyronema domesticum]CCX30206.1 Protein of unknown function [Pyronema omphalodes CBS 100304]
MLYFSQLPSGNGEDEQQLSSIDIRASDVLYTIASEGSYMDSAATYPYLAGIAQQTIPPRLPVSQPYLQPYYRGFTQSPSHSHLQSREPNLGHRHQVVNHVPDVRDQFFCEGSFNDIPSPEQYGYNPTQPHRGRHFQNLVPIQIPQYRQGVVERFSDFSITTSEDRQGMGSGRNVRFGDREGSGPSAGASGSGMQFHGHPPPYDFFLGSKFPAGANCSSASGSFLVKT